MRFRISPLAILSLAVTVVSMEARHPTNAGPEDFEIKFKLPPPPVLSPEEALKSFKVEPGFRVELVAAEPLVDTPIAMSWDERGRLYVVEMRGYMHDVDGAGEDQPLGRIKLLEDTNGDGRMDKATVFVDKLIMPRAVMAVGGGAIVSEPPTLTLYRDTDNDGVADSKTLVASDYARTDGQPEHMANSPMWAMDNWIYSSMHTKRFRYRADGAWLSEPTRSRGQYGMTQDNAGRLFYNSNSDFLRGDLAADFYFTRNSNVGTPATAIGLQVVKDQAVWPQGPTPGVNRGYEKNGLRPDGTLAKSTATCGPVIYRGDLFPAAYQGNAFIPEPAANLVKRFLVAEKEGILSADNAYQEKEFLTSPDERFRPVNAYNGPDGALYLVDMYRGIIQHKGFLTHYLVANIKERKLEQPIGMGRIYRIVPNGAKPKATTLPQESAGLVAMLAHGNGHIRDTAQRLLVERGDAATVLALKHMATNDRSGFARLHALWTLEGMGAADAAVLTANFAFDDAKVRGAAIRLAEPMLVGAQRAQSVQVLAKFAEDPATEVRMQLALSLSGIPEATPVLAKLAIRDGGNVVIRDAVLSGLKGQELELLALVVKDAAADKAMVSALAQSVMKEGRGPRVQTLLELAAAQRGVPQAAVLQGMTAAASAKGAKQKIVTLSKEPVELASLRTGNGALVGKLDAQLTWPGKAGFVENAVKPLNATEQALFTKGKQLYGLYCVGCHQPNGEGQAGLAPTLAESEWVLGPPERLPLIIMQGLIGPITVKGQPWELAMPPLGMLPDEDIAAITTYIRRDWNNAASPVSVEMVKSLRAATEGRTASWTGPELEKFKLPTEAGGVKSASALK